MKTGQQHIIILAGPNGAGKTTFALEYLAAHSNSFKFINADWIANSLSPGSPETQEIQAGRLMLQRIADLVERDENFAFETTLAGRNFARMIPNWQERGYHVSLYFLALPSSEIAIERVARRVRQGGHDVPEDVIRRRFERGLYNFENLYKPLVNSWFFYSNAGKLPVLLEKGKKDE